MKNIKNISLMMLLTLIVFASCFKLEDTEFNSETSNTFFNTEDDINAGVTVVYDALAHGTQDLLAGNSKQGGLYSVLNILLNNGGHTAYDGRVFGGNKITSDSQDVKNLYVWSYYAISKANLVLSKLNEVEMTEENRNKYAGEVRFIRGLVYFNLVQYFGGVPLRLEGYDGTYEDSLLPRATAEEVYDVIIEDFKFAETHLPLDDFNGGTHATGRATSSAASGMLAKVYLTMAGHPLNKGISHYTLARDYAKKVMDLNIYQLIPDYGNLFHILNENNREWLFCVQFGPELNDQGAWGGWQNLKPGNVDYAPWTDFGTGYGARVLFTQEMANAYHELDPRTLFNVVKVKKNGNPEKDHKYTSMKFRFAAPNDSGSANFTSVNAPVLRYADILLTFAEAENEVNGPTTEAYSAINAVRSRARAGIPFANIPASSEPADVSGLDQDAFRELVFWDRARELCLEGLDRLDLVRSGRYYELTKDAAHLELTDKADSPQPHFDLLPIPQEAIRNNSLLTQNPGY